MAELAGQGLEAGAEAGAQAGGEAAASGAGKGAGTAGSALAPDIGGVAGQGATAFGGDAFGAGAGAFGDAAAGLGGGGVPLGAGGAIDPAAASGFGLGTEAPLVTSDVALNTGASSPFGSGSGPLAGSAASGQPFAAGGTTAVSGGAASIDPAAAASAQTSGTGAASIAPASGPAATGATPADATSSWGDLLKKGLTANPLGTAIAAGGLGYNILQGQKQTANQTALSQAAGTAAGNSTKLADAGVAQVTANQGNAAEINEKAKGLEQYLTTGQLPLQYSQQVDQAINDAKTTAISNAAKNGQPTDPTKNTALAQQLAQIDGQRAGMTSKIAETLFSAGAGLTNTAANIGNQSASSLLSGGQNAANLSGQLYTTLTGIDSKQSEQTAKAIAALAQSLNSGGTPQKQAA